MSFDTSRRSLAEVGRVCVLGSLVLDHVIHVRRPPQPGETVLGSSVVVVPGGKGLNQAVAAARAGAATALIGRVGRDDAGTELLELLDREQIDRSHVRRDSETDTGRGFPVVDPAGGNAIVIVPGANDTVAADDVEAARDLIVGSSVLLLQGELPVASSVAAAHTARAADVIVVLDPAPVTPDLQELSGLVDYVVPNALEAQQLVRQDTATRPERLGELVRERYAARGVIVTLGERGAVLVEPDASSLLSPHHVDCIDSVGGGDAFCGVLAAELAVGASLADAARHANAAGALAVTRTGGAPSMPQRAELAAFLAAREPAPGTLGADARVGQHSHP